MGAGDEADERPRVLLVPFPAQGHVTPMLRLARALDARGFRSVLVVPDFIHRRLADDDGGVGFVSIPSGLGDDSTSRDFSAINRAMEEYMPGHLERILRGPGGAVVVVVVDLLASWAIGVAERCGVPVVGFWPAMLATYRLISAIPELIRRELISDCGTPLEGLLYPGHAKLKTKDLPWLVGDSNSQKSRFTFWLRILHRASTLRCLLVNSFSGEDGISDPPPHHSPQQFLQIGPLLSCIGAGGHRQLSPSIWEEDKSCIIQWLDAHRPLSTIYVSFGTWVGPIGSEKISELALGLEATRRPFIWVLREGDAWRSGLPRGFLDRVAGRGKVVAWAPQEAVLEHSAIGCYLTHCGWNSTLEAVRYGKRMLCYPIAGDQFINASYIVNVWRIGLMLDGIGTRAVREGLLRVMEGEEGEEIQERVMEMRKLVMGSQGIARAASDLECFVDALQEKCFTSTL